MYPSEIDEAGCERRIDETMAAFAAGTKWQLGAAAILA